MKAMGFGRWSSEGFVSSDALSIYDCAYMAISDYLVLTIDAPEIKGDGLEAWVSRNLSRFFPGEPDRHPFDILPRGRGAGEYRQALFTSAECLAEYRSAFPKAPLSSIIAAFRDREGDFVRVLAMPRWIEWAVKERGNWTLGERIEANGSFRTALDSLLSRLRGKFESLPVQLVYDPETENDIKDLGGDGNIAPISFPLAFDPRKARRLSHFDRERKSRSARIAAIAVLSAAALVFLTGNSLVLRAGIGYRRQRAENLEILKEIEENDASDAALAAERETLSGKAAAEAEYPGVFSLLSSLAAGLGPNARLIGFSAENGAFTVTMESANALASLGALESSGAFEGLRLSDIKASGKGERFRLTGKYHEER